MKKYEYPMWANQYKESANITHRIACQIRTATKRVVRNGVSFDQATILFTNIINAVGYWTGSTYVGSKKEPELEKAYQAFFNALYELIFKCKEIDNSTIQEWVNSILYRGKVFRYLGHSSGDDCDSKIEPIFNDIYVSWSKESTNSYIESKLRGTMTWIAAEINAPYYGIDLEGIEKTITLLTNEEFNISRGNEREVVFPTIKECITEVKYIEDDYEEQ